MLINFKVDLKATRDEFFVFATTTLQQLVALQTMTSPNCKLSCNTF